MSKRSMPGRMAMAIAAVLCAAALPARAQSWQAEGHANYQRSTQTHQQSWGPGALLAGTLGSPKSPVQLNGSLGADYLHTVGGSGPNSTSASFDLTAQPGGGGAFTPYAGGSISANWFNGDGAPSGAQRGLQYIVGAQLKLGPPHGAVAKGEVRPGYVQGQEHAIEYRLGIAVSF